MQKRFPSLSIVLFILFQGLSLDLYAQVETQYLAIELNEVLCGFTEININESVIDNQETTVLNQRTYINFSALGQDITQHQLFTYHIDPISGNFRYHSSSAEQGESKSGVEYQVTGDSIKETYLQSGEWKSDPAIQLPPGVILPNTQFFSYLVADFADGDLKSKTYEIFDVRSGQIAQITYDLVGKEILNLADVDYQSLVFDHEHPATGGTIRMWIDQETGVRLQQTYPNHLFVYLTDAGVTDRLQKANMDDVWIYKTNKNIPDFHNISYMKVKATLSPLPPISSIDELNVPGQTFTGTVTNNKVEGIFEMEYPRYRGENAPDYPVDIDPESDIQQYLASTFYIESDDPVLKNKAEEITSNSKHAWEAATRLGLWIGQNIKGGFDGGSARETYDRREGVCGNQAMLLVAFSRSLGIPARVVWGAAYVPEAGGSFGHHAWVEVYMGKDGWIPVDATIDEPSWVNSGHIRIGALSSTVQTVINFQEMEILEFKN